tara:strand:- start:168 stop:911 length:744 start_codon:yes stop_codon:yes gene_type:complete
METRQYAAKDIIFREGGEGNEAYILRAGQVEVLKKADHGEVQLAVLEPDNVFGEMALFENRSKRSATVRALNAVTVDVISADYFDRMMESVPEHMKLMINAALWRLRETSQRLAAKERTTVVLDGSIEKIRIEPAGEKLYFDPIELKTANLPYTIGGYARNEDKPRNNDLDLPCDGPPLMISQKHAKIERTNDGVFFVDVGSRFCTLVNGMVIGRGKADTRAQLQIGENKITLGDYLSPYKLKLLCE